MKGKVRYIVSLLTLAAVVAVFALVRTATVSDRALRTCQGIRIEYADGYRFVTEEDVKGYLDEHYGAYIGQRLDSIRLHRVEAILDVQSAILKSEAYTTDDGMLNVRLTQREPVLRLQKGDFGCYADSRGFIFPLQDNFTTLVPVIDGDIPIECEEGYKGAPRTDREKAWLKGAIGLVTYMEKSRTWAENIVQMHVGSDGDLVMIPREGRERFIFGSPDDAEAKFERIAEYYRYILPEKGEGYYSTVNVKFDKQIVCKK